MMHEHALENFDFFLQNEIILKFTEFDISSVPTKTSVPTKKRPQGFEEYCKNYWVCILESNIYQIYLLRANCQYTGCPPKKRTPSAHQRKYHIFTNISARTKVTNVLETQDMWFPTLKILG